MRITSLSPCMDSYNNLNKFSISLYVRGWIKFSSRSMLLISGRQPSTKKSNYPVSPNVGGGINHSFSKMNFFVIM